MIEVTIRTNRNIVADCTRGMTAASRPLATRRTTPYTAPIMIGRKRICVAVTLLFSWMIGCVERTMQVTTNPMTPFLLVNGPVRKTLDINCGAGCLGPGWRANATIGRAIRLIMINIGGALPGVYSKVSFGSPLRYSYICGENEEENPWTPFHVDRGFKPADSTVTVFKASNFCNISGGEGVGPEEILRQIATNMPPMYGGGDGVLLLLGVNHARSLSEAGLSKRDIQQRLWEMARLPASHFAEGFASTERAAGRGDAETVWRARSPDEIYIAVAGGPGPQDVYIGAGMPQTRLIR